jgi:hypothetical protein
MPSATAQLVHTRSNRHRVPKVGSGGEGDRTPDLVNAIHALSQLSYAPHSPASHLLPSHQRVTRVPRTVPLATLSTPINSPSYHPDLDASLLTLRIGESGPIECHCTSGTTLGAASRKKSEGTFEPIGAYVGCQFTATGGFSLGRYLARPSTTFVRANAGFRRFGSRSGCPGCGHPLNA